MDDHPDCVSTCTPLQNQLCYATWVTYTWVALLLRRPFLAIELCFVHLWRNQVGDHFKLKSRDGVFWMEVYQRLSELAHTQMEKVWSRISLVHNNFFEVIRCLLVRCTGSLLLLFFQLPYDYFSRHNVLTQWAQPSLQYPRSYHHFIFYRYQFDVCLFSNVCQEYVFLFFFFFNFHMIFLGAQTCWLSRRNHLYIPHSHPTECVYCSAQSFCFLEKQNFLFTSFNVNLKEAMRLSSTHVMKMTWKQNKQSQKAFRRQNVQYSRKICLRLTVFVLNQVRVFCLRSRA